MNLFEGILKATLNKIYNSEDKNEEIFLLENCVFIVTYEFETPCYDDEYSSMDSEREWFAIRYKNKNDELEYNIIDVVNEDGDNIISLMTIDDIKDIFGALVKNKELDELQFILEEYLLKDV